MADRSAAELQHHVVAKQIDELVHLAGVNSARGHWHQLVERSPRLVEEYAVLEPHRIEVLAADVVVALCRRGIAFQLADDRTGVDVVDAREAHPFCDDAKRDAVRLLARIGRMAGAVQVQDGVVPARPFRHRLDRGVADDQIDHHDDRAELLGEIGALVHVLHRGGGDVEIGSLDLPGRRLRLVDRLHAIEETVAPMHEGLRVDVLVVLGEIEAALQRLVHDPPIVAAGETELRLDGRAEQRPAELVEPLALRHDACGGALKSLHVGDRKSHVLEPQRLERLEAEHVADNRGREIGDRPRLEQVEIVGDVGEILPFSAGNRIDPEALAAIFLGRREPVGPHHRPGRGRGFARDRRGGFDRIDAVLRRHAEAGDDVGVLRRIVGLPIAHLAIFHDAGLVAVLALHGLRRLLVHSSFSLMRFYSNEFF